MIGTRLPFEPWLRQAGFVAAALAGHLVNRRGPSPFHRFGRDGEFSVEEIDERDDAGQFKRRFWRLEQDGPHVARRFNKRGQALEAAADVARARGDSVEDCAKLIGGARW